MEAGSPPRHGHVRERGRRVCVRLKATLRCVVGNAFRSEELGIPVTRVLWRGNGPGDLGLAEGCACGEGEIGLGDLVVGEGLEFGESGLGESG